MYRPIHQDETIRTGDKDLLLVSDLHIFADFILCLLAVHKQPQDHKDF